LIPYLVKSPKIILLVLLVGLVTFFISRKSGRLENSQTSLQIAFPYRVNLEKYDPANILYTSHYTLLENLYSPLVEMNANGEVVPALAKRFEWIGNNVVFTFKNNIQTVDGHILTVQDAAFSLKRLMILGKNTHGEIKDLLCPDKILKSVDDTCNGIEVSKNKLILKPRGKKPFLIPMLAAIDFAIIPRKSVDPLTLKINDFRNTSGPYYIDKFELDENGRNKTLALKANNKHFHYSKTIPQMVQFIFPPLKKSLHSSLDQFIAGKVDYILNIDKVRPNTLIQFAKDKDDEVVLHTTMDIHKYILLFTKKGLEKMSPGERFKIGGILQIAFSDYAEKTEGFKPSQQYFPILGEGGLNDQELGKLKRRFENSKNFKIGKRVIGVYGSYLGYFKDILEPYLPNQISIRKTRHPVFTTDVSQSKMPEMFIIGTDTGFLENIGLITYSFKAGFFLVRIRKKTLTG